MMGCSGQQSAYERSIADHRAELHREFRDPETSPLVPADIGGFKGLHFFPIDSTYRVVARLEHLAADDTFEMPATGARTRQYVTYGIAHFELGDQPLHLSLFKQVGSGSDYMFIPFKDLTSGAESYGGGRFIDTDMPEGDTLIIDFNLAYNPYCAYNEQYSCPIPPAENHLPVRIEAGEKNYSKHGS
jgi:uncharacterized protein (DUF1684 family)